MPDDIDAGSPLDADAGAADDIDLEDIAPEAEPDPWAEPPELEAEVDQFDRAYVEALRNQAADYRTRAKTLADAVGDLPADDIKAAKELIDSLQTEEGVIGLFTQTGRSLGLGNKELEALFESDLSKGDDEPDEDDDQIITKADLKAALKAQLDQVTSQTQEQQEASARSAATSALQATFAALQVDDADEQEEIMFYGDKFLPANGGIPTPAQVEEAVRQGKEARDKVIEKRVQTYLTQKRQQKQQTPKTLGDGGSGAGSAEEPPKDKTLTEVIAARRERERASQG